MTPYDAETAAARAAQVPWAALPLRERLRPVRELRALLVERRKALTAAIEVDIARPPTEVIATDVMPAASACKYLLTDAERILKTRKAGRTPLWMAGSRDEVFRRPHGVVGVVGTWNYPLFLNLVPVLHALTAGNAVLWKPSENTPRFAGVFSELIAASGFPAGLLQTLPATRDAGPRLAESAIDFLHFTGSEAVGRKLAARIGERLIPSVLELSGCDAFIVLADADVKLAARSAWYGLTLNRGQTCLAVRRLLVHADVRADFVTALRANADKSGPMRLLQPGQVGQANRLLADAVAAGCEVLAAPGTPADQEFTPAVALDAPPTLGLHREATFAPLAALTTFRTIDELLALNAACAYGLGGSVFGSADVPEIVARLPVGLVSRNDILIAAAHPATPLTGRGAAGWGSTQGDEGLLAMTVPQAVSRRGGTFRPHVDAGLQPLPGDTELLTGMLRLTHGRGLGDRLRGLRQLLHGVWAVRKR
jgi:acyl-CoA reductase-like NAD-dependent aldehyde dehydrogenase